MLSTSAKVSWAAGLVIALAHAAPAGAQGGGPDPAAVDRLVAQIAGYNQMCHDVSSAQPDLARQCASSHEALVAKQKALGLSDEALKAKLSASGQTRGIRFP